MNAWQLRERVDFYMDRSRSTRFSFLQYNTAGREAQQIIFDLYKDNDIDVREKMYTLITSATPTVTTTSTTSEFTIQHINYPADYHYLSYLNPYIDGTLVYCKPVNNNELNPLLLDSFRKPSNTKVYQLEDSTGWTLYRGLTGTLTVTLVYLKNPSDYSIGTEADLINEGTGVLTNATSYTCTAPSTHNGVNYNPGDQFTSANTNLTSGQVILTSKLVDSNFPASMHEDIAKKMAELMQAPAGDLNRAAFAGKEFNDTTK